MKRDNWLFVVFILTFILAFIFSAISSLATNINVFVLFILLIAIIVIGIIFDMIGVAVLSCDEATFHAKASNKIKGSKECIKLIKKSNQTSSICNDVVGDICGIISGSIATSVVFLIFKDNPVASILITATVSSLTVGGKAIGKKVAIKHSEKIIFMVGKLLNKFDIKNKALTKRK